MRHTNLVCSTLLLFSLFSPSLTWAQETYFPPKNQWEEKPASTLGMDQKALDKAIQFARENESKADPNLKLAHYQSAFGREPFGFPIGPMKNRGEASGLIIKDGYIVAK
jgi:hypothetical protein